MKTKELERYLNKNGCYYVDSRKKHDRWYSPITDSIFMVPRHASKEVPDGTLDNILKEAGLR